MSQNQINIFEQATKQKLRFQTPNGVFTVEDLWDLPLQHSTKADLDGLAVKLDTQLKESSETKSSFVKPEAVTNERQARLQLAFDIVMHIINLKIEARDAAQQASDKAARKQELLGLLAQKEAQALQEKSADEIRAMIDAL